MTAPLIVYCGLPGVGKSTASAYTADRLEAERIRTDAVRKELVADPVYTAEETARTYDAVFERTRETLSSHRPVVLDGTFGSRSRRDRAASVGSSFATSTTFVSVHCDPETVKTRIENRTDDVSDAAFEEYLLHREQFEPLERTHVTIDNSGSLEATRRQIDHHLL